MSAATRHGVPGQLNVAVLDRDSNVTGYGRHARLVVMGGTGAEARLVYVREDLFADPTLPPSTDAQRRRALNGWQRIHPRGVRLRHVSSEPYLSPSHGGECIEHVYRWESAAEAAERASRQRAHRAEAEHGPIAYVIRLDGIDYDRYADGRPFSLVDALHEVYGVRGASIHRADGTCAVHAAGSTVEVTHLPTGRRITRRPTVHARRARGYVLAE